MTEQNDLRVHMVPIDKITVVNTRTRGQTKFRQIVSNISRIGLKKPITVAPRTGAGGKTVYDLVCGQGRLEAFQALGQTAVPAMVRDVGPEDLMLMSLAENMARRQRTSIEMAKAILAQHERGDTIAEISRKVDLDRTYVRGIIRLLEHGEERLLRAVELRQIPLSIAVEIAESDDQEVQRLLSDAYKNKELRGRSLITVRNLLDRRKNSGKGMYQRGGGMKGAGERLTAEALVKVYKKETAKLQLMAKRADVAANRVQFVATAFKKLLADEGFVGLLKAESLVAIPQCLSSLVTGKAVSNGQ